MKVTPRMRQMAKALMEKRLSFRIDEEPKSMEQLRDIGCARFAHSGWWMPTDKTILATLTPAQYLVAEKLLGLGQIDRHDYKQCPGRTPTVLGALVAAGLAEALTPPGWSECDYWEATEKLKKAFAVDNEKDMK